MDIWTKRILSFDSEITKCVFNRFFPSVVSSTLEINIQIDKDGGTNPYVEMIRLVYNNENKQKPRVKIAVEPKMKSDTCNSEKVVKNLKVYQLLRFKIHKCLD